MLRRIHPSGYEFSDWESLRWPCGRCVHWRVHVEMGVPVSSRKGEPGEGCGPENGSYVLRAQTASFCDICLGQEKGKEIHWSQIQLIRIGRF